MVLYFKGVIIGKSQQQHIVSSCNVGSSDTGFSVELCQEPDNYFCKVKEHFALRILFELSNIFLELFLKESSQVVESITKTYKSCSATCTVIFSKNFNVSCHSPDFLGRNMCIGICISKASTLLAKAMIIITIPFFNSFSGFLMNI